VARLVAERVRQTRLGPPWHNRYNSYSFPARPSRGPPRPLAAAV